MVANQMEERIPGHEVTGAMESMAIAKGFGLVNKTKPAGVVAGDSAIGRLVTGTDDDTNLLDLRPQHLFENDSQD